jgi:RHS repeat-associated protein
MAVDSNGATVWDPLHEPYGELVGEFSAAYDPGLRYPGQWQDELEVDGNCGSGDCTMPGPLGGSVSLFENGYRWYRTAWGRYTQSDPLFDVGHSPRRRGSAHDIPVHIFGYAGQSPLRWIDPLGLICCEPTDECPSGKWAYDGELGLSGFDSWAGSGVGTGIVRASGTYRCIGRDVLQVPVRVVCEVTGAIGFDLGWDVVEGWSWQSAVGCNSADLFATTEGEAFSFFIFSLTNSRPSGTSPNDTEERGWTAGMGISLGAGWARTECVVERR